GVVECDGECCEGRAEEGMVTRSSRRWHVVSAVALVGALTALLPTMPAGAAGLASPVVRLGASSYTAWRQFGFDPRHTGFNSREAVLNSSNVSNLVDSW